MDHQSLPPIVSATISNTDSLSEAVNFYKSFLTLNSDISSSIKKNNLWNAILLPHFGYKPVSPELFENAKAPLHGIFEFKEDSFSDYLIVDKFICSWRHYRIFLLKNGLGITIVNNDGKVVKKIEEKHSSHFPFTVVPTENFLVILTKKQLIIFHDTLDDYFSMTSPKYDGETLIRASQKEGSLYILLGAKQLYLFKEKKLSPVKIQNDITLIGLGNYLYYRMKNKTGIFCSALDGTDHKPLSFINNLCLPDIFTISAYKNLDIFTLGVSLEEGIATSLLGFVFNPVLNQYLWSFFPSYIGTTTPAQGNFMICEDWKEVKEITTGATLFKAPKAYAITMKDDGTGHYVWIGKGCNE